MESKPTILVAEDDSSNYMYFNAVLHSKYNLLWAKNGQEAVDMALANDVDIVFMDFKMPLMNGVDATAMIKQQKPNLTVVMQTAYALEEHRQRAMYVGVDEFITKPVSYNTLVELLDRMLSK